MGTPGPWLSWSVAEPPPRGNLNANRNWGCDRTAMLRRRVFSTDNGYVGMTLGDRLDEDGPAARSLLVTEVERARNPNGRMGRGCERYSQTCRTATWRLGAARPDRWFSPVARGG